MSLVSERLKVVGPSQTKVMTARAAELRDQGTDVITLSQGEPDFDTPSVICEAGIRAIRAGQTKYRLCSTHYLPASMLATRL